MRPLIAILATTVWVSVNEFVRNQLVLADHWVEQYAGMGLTFPAEPQNGAVWGLWALCFAVIAYFISKDGGLLRAGLLLWSIGFVLMWIVIGNMAVLPFSILPVAIPWSLIEAFGAVWIMKRIAS
ncbi:MAG: hypothetical protein KDB88_04510 [Flavobacteriales bacterium]|nr:hypothetical protein [Flavobacteriales bacterium]